MRCLYRLYKCWLSLQLPFGTTCTRAVVYIQCGCVFLEWLCIYSGAELSESWWEAAVSDLLGSWVLSDCFCNYNAFCVDSRHTAFPPLCLCESLLTEFISLWEYHKLLLGPHKASWQSPAVSLMLWKSSSSKVREIKEWTFSFVTVIQSLCSQWPHSG